MAENDQNWLKNDEKWLKMLNNDEKIPMDAEN
jgi:hypothetical protein